MARVKLVIKVLFTFLALYILFSKVDIYEIKSIFKDIDVLYLILAIIFFNLSKILSSYRLNIYFSHIGVKISEIYALKLYYIGMLYNLFLPTGIGGDGYKIYILKKLHNVKISKLITATLLDRLSGLIPLILFAGLLFIYSPFWHRYLWLDYIVVIITITIFPLFYILNRLLFREYIDIFFKTTILGASVQLLQLISAIYILYSMDIENSVVIFLTLFLISSVVALLPISIGGVGLRELTFLYGLNLVNLDANSGVAFSMVFFLITATSSLLGLFLKI